MPMRQAALLTALAAAGQAAFDACGEPTKGPVLGGIDVVDAELPFVRESALAVRAQAQAMLRTGLAQQSQAQAGAALQVPRPTRLTRGGLELGRLAIPPLPTLWP